MKIRTIWLMIYLTKYRPVLSKTVTKRYRSSWLRRTASGVLSAVGFVASSAVALTKRDHRNHWKPTVDALQQYLNQTGINEELLMHRNSRLLDHLLLLYRFQASPPEVAETRLVQPQEINIQEAYKYMKYSTAVYGESMIRASEMNTHGTFKFKRASRKRISDYIGVNEDDIHLLDIDFDGDVKHLRHMVVVDHRDKKVILAIRGTFSLTELVVDAAGYSRHFCGGEAHCEVANSAERIWDNAGETILRLLRENEDYELVLTGHSLGAGTAVLLNIMCHSNKGKLVDGRQTRCFAFASPPVFTPLEVVREASSSCTNFIHENDAVPFVSIDSIRQLFKLLALIAEETKELSRFSRFRIAMGHLDPPDGLQSKIYEASQQRPSPKKGAPTLHIPSSRNFWIRAHEDKYTISSWESKELAQNGIFMHPDMLQDHFPSSYERALHILANSKTK